MLAPGVTAVGSLKQAGGADEANSRQICTHVSSKSITTVNLQVEHTKSTTIGSVIKFGAKVVFQHLAYSQHVRMHTRNMVAVAW